MPSVYMQAILWKSGQIYVSNIYCDAFSMGFHISVTIANNTMQITFFANLNDCRFDFQTYNFISLEFVKCSIWNLIYGKQPIAIHISYMFAL